MGMVEDSFPYTQHLEMRNTDDTLVDSGRGACRTDLE